MADHILIARILNHNPLSRYLAIIFIASLFLLLSCSTDTTETVEYKMGDKIKMAQYTFSADKIDDGISQIRVYFTLYLKGTPSFGGIKDSVNFMSFLTDNTHILDQGGNVIKLSEVGGNPENFNFKYLKLWGLFKLNPKQASDQIKNIRLIIINPKPKGDQPHRVSVQLKGD